MVEEISCKPVPDAETIPILPRGTLLAKASGMPLRIAVPQSGPIIKRPFFRAFCFKESSSSMLTLSEKSKICSPFSSAFSASAAAYFPAMEIRQRSAPPKVAIAFSRVNAWGIGV